MRYGGPLILLLLLLSGCSFLRRMEHTNRHIYVRRTLTKYRQIISSEIPDSLPLPSSLYPTTSREYPDLERAFEMAYTDSLTEEAVAIGFLTGRYDLVLHYADETSIEYLNGLLLIGHPAEAARLLDTREIDDAPTLAMTRLMMGDTIAAVQGLRLLLPHSPTAIRLRALRLLTLLPQSRDEGMAGLARTSPDPSERAIALSALHGTPTSHARLLLSSSPSWIREHELLRLRPLLLDAGAWTLLDDVHHALPSRYHGTLS